MKTTEILDRIKIHYGIITDKDFADILGISNTRLANWRKRDNMDYHLILEKFPGLDANFLFNGNSNIEKTNRTNTHNVNTNHILKSELEFDYGDEEEYYYNSNGNKFTIMSNGRIKIEVPRVPFSAHASYIECYFEENKTMNEFEKTTFAVDQIGMGNYISFVVKGDSMNGGGIDDTPDGAELLCREVGRHLWANLHKTRLGLVFVTKEGIFHKDFGGYDNETGMLKLISRNKAHKPFDYPINDVVQIFNVIKRTM